VVTDQIYNLIAEKQFETFWNFVEKALRGGNIVFSDAFKSLVTSIIAYDSADRPSIE
jgi:hypothetical protein